MLTPALLLLGLAWLLLIRLDAVRFHSSEMPVLLQVLGAGTPLLLGSWFGLFIPHVW